MMRFLLYLSLLSVIFANLEDIKHVIIFMQENRAFDHYYGSLSGVRGFNDRFPIPLRSGYNAFYQPVDQNDLTVYQLPFRVNIETTKAICMDAPEMDYVCDLKMWNNGHCDSWNTARAPGMGMSYFSRADLPYYYALYDAYATGDQCFQSTFTQTNPNRLHLFSGSNGLSVGQSAVLDNTEPRPGFEWETLGELLEKNNISWKVYQQIDNFDDNGFAWFKSFQQSRPGDALFDKGMKRTLSLIEELNDDMSANALPQVSILIAPSTRSEHATHHPSVGESFTSRILDVLRSHPDIYAETAFILNYDEGGQFFDHHWVPTPPLSATDGISTVSVEGEINHDVMTEVPAPIGLGFRVPLLIISPWTRGNIVVSEVFDHTSVIKFLEKRFNIRCDNISPWRRAVTGDLTSAFDFNNPDYSWPDLPDTSNYTRESIDECRNLPYPEVPAEQTLPVQESGTRISRALPYQFLTYDALIDNTLHITIANDGSAGAPFMLYDHLHLGEVNGARKYAVEGGKMIQDKLPTSNLSYHYSLFGANGFFREFSGSSSCSNVTASVSYDIIEERVLVVLQNLGFEDVTFHVSDVAYNKDDVRDLSVVGGDSITVAFDMSAYGNWYDISVQTSEFARRFAGRMETGKDTISDPAMGQSRELSSRSHPSVPEKYRHFPRVFGSPEKALHKDSLWNYQQEL